jgi:hypothetical protein
MTILICSGDAGGVTSFKATDKKVVNKNHGQQQQDQGQDDSEKVPWHKMRNLGDMEGTWDGWVLFCSFMLSFITAIVGVFQMIDKPYTAQVRRQRLHGKLTVTQEGACVSGSLCRNRTDLFPLIVCWFNRRVSSAGSWRCQSFGRSTT